MSQTQKAAKASDARVVENIHGTIDTAQRQARGADDVVRESGTGLSSIA